MQTAIHRRVAALQKGEDPTLIMKMSSGWAVLGERQVLRGYSLLLPDPVVPHLNALARRDRTRFLTDMTALGDALLEVTGATRINYAVFGNLEPALHAHVFPRFADEPAELRTSQPWAYDWTAAPGFDAGKHGDLLERVRKVLIMQAARK
jgi:diadenosine tetraphosphate (Ap4A) HIT family hydrolase